MKYGIIRSILSVWFSAFGFWLAPQLFPAHVNASDTLIDGYSDPIFLRPIVNMDFKNAEVKDVIRMLAAEYGLNIFIEDDINKRLTLHLKNVTLGDAIQFITEQNGLGLEKYGQIYKIVPAVTVVEDPPEPKTWNISYKNGLLSLDLKNENLEEVLYQISIRSGKTILLERFIDDRISGYIHELPFEQAMVHLLKNSGYIFRREGPLYQVRRLMPGGQESPRNGTSFWINAVQDRIDLELNGADLPQVLNELGRQTNVSLFLYGNVEGKVTARAENMTLEQCLYLILSGNEYTFKQNGEIYLIGEKTNKMLISSQLFQLSHIKVDGILDMLPGRISEKAEFKIIREHNALLVNGSQDIIAEVGSIVRELDRPIPQILIEALVVDFNYQNIRETSVEAGLSGYAGQTSGGDSSYGGGDKWFPVVDIYWTGRNVNHYLGKLGNFFGVSNIGKLPDDFYLKVKAMESVGKANIRSKPQIATLNGHTADITIGQTQYYILKTQTPIRDPSQIYIQESQEFQTIEANITLKITPWVSATGEITAEIHPEFNNPVGQFSSTVPPTIQRRALNSTVRMQDGETIVLGGLIQSAETVNITKIPLLGSLPLVGRLFQNRSFNNSKSELIIYITPHLSYGDELLYEG